MAGWTGIPLIGGIFEDPKKNRAARKLKRQYAKMAEAYQEYRPQAAALNNQSLAAQFGLFNPVQEALSSAYPTQSPFDLQGVQDRLQDVTQGLGIASYAGSKGISQPKPQPAPQPKKK